MAAILNDDYDTQSYWPSKRLYPSAIPCPGASTSSSIINTLSDLTDTSKSGRVVCESFNPATPSSYEEILTTTIYQQPIVSTDTNKAGKHDDSMIPSTSKENRLTTEQYSEIGEKRVRYVGDLTEDHFSSPKHAKKNFQFLMNTIKRQRDKINHLAISKRRLEKKVDSFESMMKHLY
ncbi:hypothetical protein QE152_g36170 [Popillia japonica]|uniref:Uncharacterized protein n=1 Tax=Popillia japonica TaxID=7064 RepID=A0AAW1IDE4_POPJA